MHPILLQSPNYDNLLRESIKSFLAGIHRENSNSTGFRSVILRHLHSTANPPLEIVWLYSAAIHHDRISSKTRSDRVSAARDLIQLLSAFSSAGNGAKSIAMIAPAVYDLYRCAEEGLIETKEMECLAEGVLSYVSICCSQNGGFEERCIVLNPCFVDLVGVWTLRRSRCGGILEEFFPLICGEVLRRFEVEGCGIGCLAGVVIADVFLMRLCLKVRGGGGSRNELQKELGIWAVSSITAFRNRDFFEILLKFLLDPKVNAASLLNTEDEKLARGVLYDAVVLVDYSFLFAGKEMDQYDRIRNLLVTKLIVTNEAVKIARTKGDHSKAISYLNAFSTSSLPSELINLVRNQIGDLSSKKPDNNSPESLLKWLFHLEQTGKRILDDAASKYAAHLTSEGSNQLAVQPAYADHKTMDADLFFFDKGELNDDEMESMDAVFSSAAQSMKHSSSNGRVKRKESTAEAANRFKLLKYDVQNNLIEDSEVENPPSDADMEESDG